LCKKCYYDPKKIFLEKYQYGYKKAEFYADFKFVDPAPPASNLPISGSGYDYTMRSVDPDSGRHNVAFKTKMRKFHVLKNWKLTLNKSVNFYNFLSPETWIWILIRIYLEHG
jgi:hypothetical protein